jgi:enamine deaminase RidA (YjgF/YER057c/UK114 family)
VWVAGTTGTRTDGSVPDGVEAQARLALDTIEAALIEAGSSIADVVVSRTYVVDIEDWEPVAHALRDRFNTVRPAMTMVEVSRLMAPEHLVEIEVEAVISSDAG